MGSSRRWKRSKQLAHSRGRAEDGRYKISEVLLDFAEPLLNSFELPRDSSAFRGAVKVAALLWNAMVDPPPDGPASAYVELGKKLGSPPTRELVDVFDLMIARGRAKYSHIRELIGSVDVEVHDDGRATVRVIAVV